MRLRWTVYEVLVGPIDADGDAVEMCMPVGRRWTRAEATRLADKHGPDGSLILPYRYSRRDPLRVAFGYTLMEGAGPADLKAAVDWTRQ